MPETLSIRDIPLLVSMVAAVSIALSIAYELGYLVAIDHTLLALFSVQDAVVGALHFVPFALFFSVGTVLILGALVSIHGSIESDQSNWSKWLDRLTFLGPLLGGIYALLATQFRFFGVLLIVSALLDLVIGVINRRFQSRRQPLLAIAGIFWSLAVAFCIAGVTAQEQLASKIYNYEITTEDGPLSANLLKSGSEFLLVRATDSTVTVIPRNEIKKIEVKKIEAPKPWLSLNLFRRSIE